MPIYVDGFVVPIPKKSVAAYRKIARKAGKVWKEHGALEYRECVGDELNVAGMATTFPKQLKLKRGDTVLFSWVVYRSKADRNRIIKKVMEDPRLQMDESEMPFDVRRMLFGGFKAIIDL